MGVTIAVIMTDKKSKKVPGALIMIGAWLTVGLVGTISLLSSLLLSGAFLGDPAADGAGQRFLLIFGFIGLEVLVLLIIALWKHRERFYVQQLLIGIWIGVAIYTLLLGGGAVVFVAHNVSKFGDAIGCSTLDAQYTNLVQSTVPIATEDGTGTGFAVVNGNTILTAHHVIEGAKTVKINLVNDERPAKVIDDAPEYDLALLHIDKPMESSMSMTEIYAVSDPLYALGFPGNTFEAGQASLSSGILSRILSNDDLRLTSQEIPSGLEMVQTDMALNPGNSGGPIINECGVVGIVSMKSNSLGLESISSEEGINYGISSKTAASRFKLPISNQ